MPTPWKLLGTKYLIDNKWMKLLRRTFLLPNGELIPDYYIVERPDASMVLAVTPERKVLIIEEFERGVMEVGYRFPAGMIEKNESPIDTAKREFLEETNLEVDSIKQIGILYSDPGWLTSRLFVFLVSVNNTEFRPSINPRELYDLQWMDFDEFGDKIKNGMVHNVLVVAAFHLAQTSGDI